MSLRPSPTVNAAFLKPLPTAIGIFNPPDVRPILKAYEGKDIPSEYAKKEAESKKAAIEEWERKNPASRSGGGGGGFLGGMFGSVSPVSFGSTGSFLKTWDMNSPGDRAARRDLINP